MDNETDREFFRAVVEMRKAQKLYFATRDGNDLHAAKELEKTVDRLIKDNGQKALFDD